MDLDFLPPPVPEPTPSGIRVLTPEEIETIAHIFTERGAPLPDPSISCFVGAVEDGRVVGFVVLQLRLHAEPVWVEEGRSAIFPSLVKGAESVIITRTGPQWVYLFAPAGRISQLAQAMGMQMEPWVVLSKLVQPEAPLKTPIDLTMGMSHPEDAPPISREELEQYPGEGPVQ